MPGPTKPFSNALPPCLQIPLKPSPPPSSILRYVFAFVPHAILLIAIIIIICTEWRRKRTRLLKLMSPVYGFHVRGHLHALPCPSSRIRPAC